MKTLAVHQNLDTSFVNLSALLRYLREQKFTGQVLVRLNSYKAEITFDAGCELKVFEHDKIAGRIAEGGEALQRLLIRAREAGGTIDVFRFVNESDRAQDFAQKSIEKPNDGNEFFSFAIPKNHSPLPLEFTNRVEDRARLTQLSEIDWQTFSQLIGELLGSVDNVLAAADLNFTEAFAKVCAEIAGDYPFLNFADGAFIYQNGTVELNARPSAKLLSAGINEALRRILDDLADSPQFAETYRDAAHRILALIHKHKLSYGKFFITPQLERIVGV